MTEAFIVVQTAEQAVDRACQAYLDRDLTRCQMVLEGETQINISEREIDELAFDMLAMQQPMAVDLRFILAVTKINADLERVGDQAVNIAERVMDMVALPAVDTAAERTRLEKELGEFDGRDLALAVAGAQLTDGRVGDLVTHGCPPPLSART